jgi:hypothetical protein
LSVYSKSISVEEGLECIEKTGLAITFLDFYIDQLHAILLSIRDGPNTEFLFDETDYSLTLKLSVNKSDSTPGIFILFGTLTGKVEFLRRRIKFYMGLLLKVSDYLMESLILSEHLKVLFSERWNTLIMDSIFTKELLYNENFKEIAYECQEYLLEFEIHLKEINCILDSQTLLFDFVNSYTSQKKIVDRQCLIEKVRALLFYNAHSNIVLVSSNTESGACLSLKTKLEGFSLFSQRLLPSESTVQSLHTSNSTTWGPFYISTSTREVIELVQNILESKTKGKQEYFLKFRIYLLSALNSYSKYEMFLQFVYLHYQ